MLFDRHLLPSTCYVLLGIVAHPGSRKPRIEVDEAKIWHVYVRERATEGKANDAVIGAVAEELGISKTNIRIIKGHRSKHKILEY